MEQRLIDANKIEFNTVRYPIGAPWPPDKEKQATMGEIEWVSKYQIENQPTVDAVPRSLYEQIRWERDVALSQLKQLNIELFEKPYLKAIPIEWIKETIKLAETVQASKYAEHLRILLEDWRKENDLG